MGGIVDECDLQFLSIVVLSCALGHMRGDIVNHSHKLMRSVSFPSYLSEDVAGSIIQYVN